MQVASESGDFMHERHVASAGGRAKLVGDFRLPHWKRQADWRFKPAMSRLVGAVQQPRRKAAGLQQKSQMPLAICVGLKSQRPLAICVLLRLKVGSWHSFLAFEFACVNRESEIACVERELVACCCSCSSIFLKTCKLYIEYFVCFYLCRCLYSDNGMVLGTVS